MNKHSNKHISIVTLRRTVLVCFYVTTAHIASTYTFTPLHTRRPPSQLARMYASKQTHPKPCA